MPLPSRRPVVAPHPIETRSQFRPGFAAGRIGAVLLLLAVAPAIRAEEASPETVERARYVMGTVFRFQAVPKDAPGGTAEALERALDEVERLDAILSNWRSESELMQLNGSARRTWVAVSTDLFGAVEAARRWASETNGAFDPTVEPRTRAFRGDPPAAPLALESSSGTQEIAGTWREVELDRTHRSVRLGPRVGGLDLGGIGKGFALDRAAEILRGRGIAAFLLDAGGQLLAAGAPPGLEGWPAAIADPGERSRPGFALLLRDVSAATSGNGERPGEILDPATGEPVRFLVSATALARDATSADAVSTALFVMGPERGLVWSGPRADLAAVYLEPGPGPGAPSPFRISRPIGTPRAGPLWVSSEVLPQRSIVDVRLP